MVHNKLHIYPSFNALNKDVVVCTKCPRLVEFRENVPVRKSYENECYWRRPVPGFGDKNGWLMITGLAPAAHGGNRTGRLFTGDKSSEFLIKALYESGFANQPTSEYLDDGLELNGCYITAAVKCVPPKDKPTRQEMLNCSTYYYNELNLLENLTHVLALGKLAFDAYLFIARKYGSFKTPKFQFGQRYELPNMPVLYASYHPSPQNTNTGKLTAQMFNELLSQLKQ